MSRSRSKSVSQYYYIILIPQPLNPQDFQLNQLNESNSKSKYTNLLRQIIQPKSKHQRYNPYQYSKNVDSPLKSSSPIRKIPSKPYKILDAPKLKDDFYYQLIDWGINNQIAVGLENSLYTWNPLTNETTQLFYIERPTHISSVKWCERNDYLAVGDDYGIVRVFDVVKAKMIYQYEDHQQRVGCLDWNGISITSGSRDKRVLLVDIRTEGAQIQFNGHKQEICGIEWSPSETLLATGGNDNQVLIQSLRMPSQPLHILKEHCAAVKALAWSPHNNQYLCSGGGTTDKTLKIWNSNSGELIKSIETGSQICNMKWSINTNELVTSHGFSLNQVAVWKLPNMDRIATLYGHSYRVLYMAISPDGENVVTGSGDETLRFWKLFPQKRKNSQNLSQSALDVVQWDLR